MRDLRNLFPAILIAETMMVMIPIGAMPIMMISRNSREADRNCLVGSSPNKVKRGAKLVKAFLSKLYGSMSGMAVGAAISRL